MYTINNSPAGVSVVNADTGEAKHVFPRGAGVDAYVKWGKEEEPPTIVKETWGRNGTLMCCFSVNLETGELEKVEEKRLL